MTLREPAGRITDGSATPTARTRDELLPLRLVPATASTLISPAVWQAFDRAVADAITVFGDAAGSAPGSLAPVVGALRIAVKLAAVGAEPELEDRQPPGKVTSLVECIRRSLIREARKEALDPAEVLRLLSALERVQDFLEREGGKSTAAGAIPEGRDLLVEVAHDMRSPLSAILVLVEALRGGRSGPVSPLQERQLGLVYGAAFGLSQVATDLIDLAHGGERLVNHRPVPFSVSELLQSLRNIIQPIAEEKRLAVRTSGPVEDGRIGHPAALTRVLLNLATNALKFTSEGSVDIIAKEISRTRIEFSVRDTGRGIPKEVLAGLFQPFRKRPHSDGYAFSNAGLGLSICRRLVGLMGSELRVSTGAHRGTWFTFVVELPIAGRPRRRAGATAGTLSRENTHR